MPDRNIALFVDDIMDSICAIEDFTHQIGFDAFIADRKTYSATLREFIVIAEAMDKLPDVIKSRRPAVAWRLIKDFRNFIVHEYFGVDPEIVWDAVKKELPILKKEMILLRQEIGE